MGGRKNFLKLKKFTIFEAQHFVRQTLQVTIVNFLTTYLMTNSFMLLNKGPKSFNFCSGTHIPSFMAFFSLVKLGPSERWYSPRVNLANQLVQSANAPAYRFWHIRCHSVSPTKLCPTWTVYTSRSYAQLLHSTLYAMCQKFSVNLMMHKIMTKLTPGRWAVCPAERLAPTSAG